MMGPELNDLEGGNRRGAENRTGQEWEDEKNRQLYVIEQHNVPGATENQRKWVNNRMNQSMVWADFLGYDFGVQDGFGLAPDEVKEIEQVLRAVCIAAATDAPDDDDEDEDREGGDDFEMGSPLLWTILIGLQVIAEGENGFAVATESMRNTATLEGIHEYMWKFKGWKQKRYQESTGQFYTRAAGSDAKMAQSRLAPVKTRMPAYYPLGADLDKRQAKIDKLDGLLKKSGAFNGRGLSGPVLRGEPPALLPPDARHVKDVHADARPLEKARFLLGGGGYDGYADTEARSSSAASDAASEVRVRVRVELTRAPCSRTQAGPWQRRLSPCHTPCVPNAAVPCVARTDRTRTPIRTWRRQSRLARLRRPARAAPTLLTTHVAPPPPWHRS